jgi:hypothetical protein
MHPKLKNAVSNVERRQGKWRKKITKITKRLLLPHKHKTEEMPNINIETAVVRTPDITFFDVCEFDLNTKV